MKLTTAPPEFCSHCGQRLGMVRVILVGTEVVLHPYCVEPWHLNGFLSPMADTASAGRRALTEQTAGFQDKG